MLLFTYSYYTTASMTISIRSCDSRLTVICCPDKTILIDSSNTSVRRCPCDVGTNILRCFFNLKFQFGRYNHCDFLLCEPDALQDDLFCITHSRVVNSNEVEDDSINPSPNH